MRSPRPRPALRTRHILAVAVVFAQVVAATGAPILTPPKSTKTASVPYPCQNHPCGCTTSEQGWAGDCCCFTLEQKLAWAESHGIEPPEHVRPTVEARAARKAKSGCCSKSKKPSCCSAHESAETKSEDEPPAPKLTWVAGIFAQKCRGEGPAGSLEVEASIAPALPSAPREPRPTRDFARPPDTHIRSASLCPPVPPPRAS
jgi:hypothetical protein